MFRRAETREEDALLRDARAINDKVRLLAKLGAALLEAKENGAELGGAVELPPSAGRGWRRASPRPSASCGPTR